MHDSEYKKQRFSLAKDYPYRIFSLANTLFTKEINDLPRNPTPHPLTMPSYLDRPFIEAEIIHSFRPYSNRRLFGTPEDIHEATCTITVPASVLIDAMVALMNPVHLYGGRHARDLLGDYVLVPERATHRSRDLPMDESACTCSFAKVMSSLLSGGVPSEQDTEGSSKEIPAKTSLGEGIRSRMRSPTLPSRSVHSTFSRDTANLPKPASQDQLDTDARTQETDRVVDDILRRIRLHNVTSGEVTDIPFQTNPSTHNHDSSHTDAATQSDGVLKNNELGIDIHIFADDPGDDDEDTRLQKWYEFARKLRDYGDNGAKPEEESKKKKDGDKPQPNGRIGEKMEKSEK